VWWGDSPARTNDSQSRNRSSFSQQQQAWGALAEAGGNGRSPRNSKGNFSLGSGGIGQVRGMHAEAPGAVVEALVPRDRGFRERNAAPPERRRRAETLACRSRREEAERVASTRRAARSSHRQRRGWGGCTALPRSGLPIKEEGPRACLASPPTVIGAQPAPAAICRSLADLLASQPALSRGGCEA